MTWTPIVGRGMNHEQLREYITGLDFSAWRPSLIVWHNTAAPTLAQWRKTAREDEAKGLAPGVTRIMNLQAYFRDQRGWPSGPHAFVADDLIWPFTPFNRKGTHSPSWNGMSIGIEMVGDFSREDDDSGYGLKVRQNTVALTAMLCEKLGLDPTVCIRLHKEDKATTHDCPGKDIAQDKAAMIQEVVEFMGHAGNHTDTDTANALAKVEAPVRKGTVTVADGDSLNLRDKATASGRILAKLKKGALVIVHNAAMNGTTKWLYVEANNQRGWVAARYVKES